MAADDINFLVFKWENINKPNSDGHCFLWMAARYGAGNEIIELAIEKGADINHRDDEFGSSALHVAIIRNRIETVRILLKNGADPNLKTLMGWTKFPLIISAEKNYYEITSLLLTHNADVNQSDDFGDTALLAATMKGNLDIVKLLMQYNADFNKANKAGFSPLSMAKSLGYTEIYDIFITASL